MPYSSPDHNDLQHWLELTLVNTNWSNTKDYFSYLLGTRGYPSNAFFTFTTDTNTLAFHRVWVTLTTGGTNYYLDPAFKISEPITGIDLDAASQASSNDLWTASAGTENSNYVVNVNETAVRNKLRDYTTNLVWYLQSNCPNASVE